MVRKLTLALVAAGSIAAGAWLVNEDVTPDSSSELKERASAVGAAANDVSAASRDVAAAGAAIAESLWPAPSTPPTDHESVAATLIKSNAPVAQVEAALRDALHARPSDAYSLGALVDLLRADGRGVDIESIARTVLAFCPDCPDATLLLGETLASLGDFDGAVVEYQRATRLAGVEEAAWRALADLHEKNGEPARARRALEVATSLAVRAGAYVPTALERDRERIARLAATEE